jgi:hypothetical protein
VKSLAYDDPRYTCSVLNTSSSETPSVFACVRFTSRKSGAARPGSSRRGADEPRLHRGLLDGVLDRALEPVGTDIAAILHVELNPPVLPRPLDRRCTEHDDLRREPSRSFGERREYVRRLLPVRDAPRRASG